MMTEVLPPQSGEDRRFDCVWCGWSGSRDQMADDGPGAEWCCPRCGTLLIDEGTAYLWRLVDENRGMLAPAFLSEPYALGRWHRFCGGSRSCLGWSVLSAVQA